MTSQRFLIKGNVKRKAPKTQVACVAVINGDKILMGKRRDNDRWTCPGGHMDEGETPLEGAQRELYEETSIGLTPNKFKVMGYKDVVSPKGKKIRVHTFKVKYSGPTSMGGDPDDEVYRWRWLDMNDMPKEVMKNLHNGDKDIILTKLGIYDKNKVEKSFVIKADKLPGGLADKKSPKDFDKKMLKMGVKVELEHTKDKQLAREIAMDHLTEDKQYYIKLKKIEKKSMSFVIDLIKSMRSHKYLRKFRRGDKWIYVYHEPNKKPRQLDEHAMRALKVLAERRMKGAHTLLENVEEIHDTKIRALLALADRGHERAQKQLAELGIEHETEILERRMMANPLRSPASQGIKQNIEEAIRKASDRVFGHLSSYQNDDRAKRLIEKFGSLDAGKEKLANVSKENVYDAIKGVNEMAKEIEEAQAEFYRPDGSFDSRTASEGYGQRMFDTFVSNLEERGILPRGYKDALGRKRGEELDIIDPRELERIQREREEREERERAERLAAVEGTMAYSMMMAREDSTRVNPEDALKLDETLKRIFGRELTNEDFPYDFSAHGLTTKIKGMTINENSVSMSLQIYTDDGKPIMSEWKRSWSLDGGKPSINNSYMKVRPEMRGRGGVGDLINAGQRELLKKVGKGRITVYANIDVGGYNWANQGFDFSSSNERNSFVNGFASFLRRYNINLSDSDKRLLKHPMHIAAFTNGQKYETSLRDYIGLSETQIRTRSLTGVEGQNTLTDAEIRSGKTNRMMVHLGKMYLLNKSWDGYWDVEEHGDHELTRYADAYKQMRDNTYSILSSEYRSLMVSGGSGTPDANDERAGRSTSSIASRLIRTWSPSGSGNIRMTPNRVARIARLSDEHFNDFMANAPLTRDARNRIREARDGR